MGARVWGCSKPVVQGEHWTPNVGGLCSPSSLPHNLPRPERSSSTPSPILGCLRCGGGGSKLGSTPPPPNPARSHGNAGCEGSRPLAADDVTSRAGQHPHPKKRGWGRGAPPHAAPPRPWGPHPAPPGTAPGAAAAAAAGDALGGGAGDGAWGRGRGGSTRGGLRGLQVGVGERGERGEGRREGRDGEGGSRGPSGHPSPLAPSRGGRAWGAPPTTSPHAPRASGEGAPPRLGGHTGRRPRPSLPPPTPFALKGPDPL